MAIFNTIQNKGRVSAPFVLPKALSFAFALYMAICFVSTGCGQNGNSASDTAAATDPTQNAVYDSALCAKLMLIAPDEIDATTYMAMVEQALALSAELRASLEGIQAGDMTPESVNHFHSVISSPKMLFEQHFYGELFVDFDALGLDQNQRAKARQAQEQGAELQRLFEGMFQAALGADGDAASPEFYSTDPNGAPVGK